MLSDVLHLVGVRAPPMARASNRGSHSARAKPNPRLGEFGFGLLDIKASLLSSDVAEGRVLFFSPLGAQAMKASSKHLASAATTYIQNISGGKRSIANLHTMKLSEM